jgi:hypothetical protein
MATNLSRGELLERLQRVRRDPLEFLKCVRTLDEVDKRAPVKTFPWNLEYVQLYVKIWREEQFIALPKSRRMKMTWLNVSLFLWDTLFYRGRANGFISKKEDDSDKLVERAQFIYENLDTSKLPRELLPKVERKFCNMHFAEINSRIQGYASSSDGPRMDTLSGALCDEIAFWPHAQKLYSGLVPTLEGNGDWPNSGGRLTAISSAAPGFFKAIVHDTLDDYGTEGDLG